MQIEKQFNERSALKTDIADHKFAKYLFRTAGVAGVIGIAWLTGEAIVNNVENKPILPAVLTDIAVAAATVTVIPAERHASRALQESQVKLRDLDNPEQ